MLRRIRDWVFTVPLLVGFGLTLLVHDIAGRIALLFGLRPFERVMASLQRSLVGIYRVAGTRVNVERSPEIKPNTGYLIISNHQSLFDIAIIGGLLFTNYPKYVAIKAASDLPIVPTAIDGAWKLLRHNMLPVPFGTTVNVRFGDPIPRSPEEDPDKLLEQAHQEIAETLARWRAE